MPKPKKHVFVCVQNRPPGHPRGACQAQGGGAVHQAFLEAFQARALWGEFALSSAGCLGPCQAGPSVLVYPEGVMYGGLVAADVGAIIDEHLLGGTPVERLQVPAALWG